MSVERVFHCDGPECERHVRTSGARPPGFLTVAEDTGDELHFCTWDCIMRTAASKPPAEVVPADAA